MSTLIGSVVKLIFDRGVVSAGDRSAPYEGEITGTLKRLDALGVTVFDEMQHTDVFVPIGRVIQIIDQGRRGSI